MERENKDFLDSVKSYYSIRFPEKESIRLLCMKEMIKKIKDNL